MTSSTFTCVHLTRIRPGKFDDVNQRLSTFAPDPDELGRQGIRSLQLFATTETCADGLVVAIVEGVDQHAVLRFLEQNEQQNRGAIDELYEPHTHEAVIEAPVKYRFP